MTIYVLSSFFQGQHHSNSKQQDAYQYPRQYGISSPSFARATSVEYPEGNLLFISGTASIIGHKSLHQGNLTAQLETTKNNIMHLLAKTGYTTESVQTMKVYLRCQSDLSETQAILDKAFPKALKLFTLADICRSDLLVEVECFCSRRKRV
jgi:chorismate lyase/3-hydroxybenzoate synthase